MHDYQRSPWNKKRLRERGENVLDTQVYAVFEEIFGAGIALVAIDARNHSIGKTYLSVCLPYACISETQAVTPENFGR